MTTGERHSEKVRNVCAFIDANLDTELSQAQLLQVSACSRYHFHRIFKAVMGVSVRRYAQLARLRRASYRLAFEPGIRITDIALEAGFESPEAFSRAFQRISGQTPSGFRKTPRWQSWRKETELNPPAGELKMDVSIVDFPTTGVAVLEHKGNPGRILETVAEFIEWRRATGLSPIKTSLTIGIPHSDPETTDEADFRFDVCGSIEGEVPANRWGVQKGTIPGGRCARVTHKGSHNTIIDSVWYLYRNWLPGSGAELRDFPCYFHYRNFVHEVDECDLLTDIYLPLK